MTRNKPVRGKGKSTGKLTGKLTGKHLRVVSYECLSGNWQDRHRRSVASIRHRVCQSINQSIHLTPLLNASHSRTLRIASCSALLGHTSAVVNLCRGPCRLHSNWVTRIEWLDKHRSHPKDSLPLIPWPLSPLSLSGGYLSDSTSSL